MSAPGAPYWLCPRCGNGNAATAAVCRACGLPTPRPAPSGPSHHEGRTPPDSSDDDPPVLVETYSGATPDASAKEFAADAVDMLAEGYEAVSQVWHGSALTVTYRRMASRPTDGPLVEQRSTTTISGIGMVVGGAMMAAGSFLPWITASTGLGSVSRSGMEGGDGIFIAALGGLTILGGIAALLGNAGWALAIFGSLVGGFIGFLDFQEAQRRVAETGADGIAVVQVGIGMWLILTGAVVGFIAAVVAWRASRKRA